MKVLPKHFSIALAALAAFLIGFSILRGVFGLVLPKAIDENLPNAVIVAALGIFLWNRKMRSDEAKAAAAVEAAKAASEAAESASIPPPGASAPDGDPPLEGDGD